MSNRQLVGSRDRFGQLLDALFTLLGSTGYVTGRDDGYKSPIALSFGAKALQAHTMAAIFLCGTILFFPGQSWAQASGLVAAYSFNEGAGSTLTDISGNGNNGTIAGAAWTTSGKSGNALVFNGTSAQVTVANSTSLQLTTGMTLEAWVFPTATPTGWKTVIAKNVDAYYLEASTPSGNRPGVGGIWTAGNQTTIGPSVIAVNTWTHLAATFDGAMVRLFVNGVQVASLAQTTSLAPTTGTLQIGGSSYPTEYFAGRIDDVRIYNRALTAAQIQTDMNTPVGGTPAPDTTAPSAPAGLGATTIGVTQINLAWTASTDNIGVTGYRVERCQGTGCTTFAQVATPTTISFSNTGLTAATAYRYRVRAVDAAGNLSAYSSIASLVTLPVPDATAPTVSISSPAAGATVSATTTITASAADNIGVAGVQFLLDGASLGAELTAPPFSLAWNTTSVGNGTHTLSARARDIAGNTTTAANRTVTVANSQGSGLVAAYSFNEGAGSTLTDISGNGNNGTIAGAAWTTSGKSGNALVFNGTSAQVTVANSTSLQLTTGMTLEAWVFPTATPTGWKTVIAKNVDAYYLEASTPSGNRPGVGGIWTAGNQTTIGPSVIAVNTWTHLAATFDGAMVRLFVNGVQVASLAQTTSLAPTTGTLQIGGSSYPTEYFAGRIDDVRIYNRALTAAQIQTDMNTPVGGTPAPDTTAPSAPAGLGATTIGVTQINLAWTASTDNIGVTGYRVERCQGTGCTTFAQVATPTTISFSNTGLTAATAYRYRVRAVDAAGNLSAYSSIVSATTLATSDTTAPSTPTSLTANAASASQINLSWSAATDNVGVTGYRVYRSGTLLVTLGNVTTYQNTGLSASTTYSYTVQALDAAGNASIISTTASAATQAPSITANLAWDAVTATNLSGYRIYYGTAPGTYLQPLGQGINAGNVTTYTVMGLNRGTRYYFVVTAYDTTNKESAYSNEVFKDIP